MRQLQPFCRKWVWWYRRSRYSPSNAAAGCGTLLVALLVLAIITAIVIFLGAFGLLGWIFS
jgi:hypothetical protein